MKRPAGKKKKKENITETHREIGHTNNIQRASNLLSTFLTILHLTVSWVEVSQLSIVSHLEDFLRTANLLLRAKVWEFCGFVFK